MGKNKMASQLTTMNLCSPLLCSSDLNIVSISAILWFWLTTINLCTNLLCTVVLISLFS